MRRPAVFERIYGLLPVALQSQVMAAGLLNREKFERTRYFPRILERYEATVDDPVEVLHQRQWDQLKQLIERARVQVPYYRFLPPTVDTGDPYESIVKALANIPPLEKAVYKARSRDFVSRDIPRRQLIRLATSGTTGTALPVWHTSERMAEGKAAVWRMRRSFGVDRNDPVIEFSGQMIVPHSQQKPPFWRYNRFLHATIFSTYHLSPPNMSAYIDGLHAADATYVHGYPSVLHLVARAMVEAGRCFPPGQLKTVFTHSESVLAFQRDTIEQAFGTKVHDWYHSTEEAVSMTACREDRLHVDMGYGIVEVEVVDETDEFVRGPLLVTGLGSVATPFIRYRIGDHGTRLKKPCPCGRPGDVFLDIDGRIEDYVLTPDGRLVGRMDHVFKEQHEIELAQIVQTDASAIDILVVAKKFDDRARRSLIRQVHSRLGPKIRVNIQLVDEIPVDDAGGKFRAVKSSVGELES